MFSKRKQNVNDSIETPRTIISEEIEIQAVKMVGNESVRIDGHYKGIIDLNGPLVLGESGHINGDVRANYFLIAGEVQGNITCDTQLHLTSTAKVMGNVQSKSLIIDEGAQVHGMYIIQNNHKPVIVDGYLNQEVEHNEDTC